MIPELKPIYRCPHCDGKIVRSETAQVIGCVNCQWSMSVDEMLKLAATDYKNLSDATREFVRRYRGDELLAKYPQGAVAAPREERITPATLKERIQQIQQEKQRLDNERRDLEQERLEIQREREYQQHLRELERLRTFRQQTFQRYATEPVVNPWGDPEIPEPKQSQQKKESQPQRTGRRMIRVRKKA